MGAERCVIGTKFSDPGLGKSLSRKEFESPKNKTIKTFLTTFVIICLHSLILVDNE